VAKPAFMSYSDWMKDTTVTKWHGQSDYKRSQALQNVDLFLQEYEKSTDEWPKKLRLLQENLSVWLTGKKSKGKLQTKRDNQTVNTLVQQVEAARKLHDPVKWDSRFPGVSIAQDPFAGDFEVPVNFSAVVRRDLGKLISKDRGEALMTMVSNACETQGHEVVIQYSKSAGGNQCAPVNVTITNDFRRALSEPGGVNMTELMGNRSLLKTNGAGANAVVKYNPDDVGEATRESFVALAHELVHGYHFVNGLCGRLPTGGTMGDQGGAEEEMRTVGAGGYEGEEPSENWIREEWGFQPRTSYSGNDFTSTKASCLVTKFTVE